MIVFRLNYDCKTLSLIGVVNDIKRYACFDIQNQGFQEVASEYLRNGTTISD